MIAEIQDPLAPSEKTKRLKRYVIVAIDPDFIGQTIDQQFRQKLMDIHAIEGAVLTMDFETDAEAAKFVRDGIDRAVMCASAIRMAFNLAGLQDGQD